VLTIPILDGTIEMIEVDGNTVNITINGFNPFFGLTKDKFDAKAKTLQGIPLLNEYIEVNQEGEKYDLFQPLSYYLYAKVLETPDDEFVQLWRNVSDEIVENYVGKITFDNFIQDTTLVFQLWVQNNI
jgi:hypothetical protein